MESIYPFVFFSDMIWSIFVIIIILLTLKK